MSSTPVTVTVCATFQFALVNVRLAGATVPSVVSLELERDRHVRRRLTRQHDRERRGAAGLRRGQAGGRRDGDARAVVVGVGDRDVGRVDPVVVRVGARRRGRDDAVGDVAVVHGVVHAGHGDGLRDVPVRAA